MKDFNKLHQELDKLIAEFGLEDFLLVVLNKTNAEAHKQFEAIGFTDLKKMERLQKIAKELHQASLDYQYHDIYQKYF
ncbi:MAG: hypothetical protein QNJ41_17980 [Xenococcaceae cyanobacterium MO_188.B32]|nr:hypothetical protein [Xenococcaceae cyanobacterium MO_188.B32]